MASNSPLFQLEDQTDEDFFDKLVDDDYVPSKVVKPPDVVGFTNEDSEVNSGRVEECDEGKVFDDLSRVSLGRDNEFDESNVFDDLTEVNSGRDKESGEAKVIDNLSRVGSDRDKELGEGKVVDDLSRVGSVQDTELGEAKVFDDLSRVGPGRDNELDEGKVADDLSRVGSGRDNELEEGKVVDELSRVGSGRDKELSEANVFDNLSRVGSGQDNEFEGKVVDNLGEVGQSFGNLSMDEKGGEDGVVGELEGLSGVNEVNNNGGGLEVVDDMSGGKDGGLGVKQVGWSALFADSGQNDGGDFGSEFFTEIGVSFGGGEFSGIGYYSGDFPGSISGGMDVVASNEAHKSDSFGNSLSYAQYFEGHAYSGSVDDSNDQQDLDSSQCWESLYPGWKYDTNTGQWYQVDAQDSTGNHQGCHEVTTSTREWDAVPEQKSEISYLQQTVQPVFITSAESGTSENVTSWNQASQENDDWKNSQLNSGYPEHMLFYPEYPGWYFDMIAQEWRSLESYNSSVQLTGQTHDQQKDNSPNSTFSYYNDSSYGEYGQTDNHGSPASFSQGQASSWAGSGGSSTHHDTNTWRPDTAAAKIEPVSSMGSNQLTNSAYSLMSSVNNQMSHQNSHSFGAMPSYGNTSAQTQAEANGSIFPKFVPGRDLSQPFSMSQVEQNEDFSKGLYGSRELISTNQRSFQIGHQFPFVSSTERSSAGRPAHALVTFGFGGKLVVVENNSSFSNLSYGSQDIVGGSISVLNLAEVVMESTDASGVRCCSCGYFNGLCKESFPGPLVGGNPGTKELNKWIDERIANSESPDVDRSNGRILKLLFSLLKIACQHYGKLRSPFGTDVAMRESDTPEAAVAKLFASAKKDLQLNQYGAFNQCMQNIPSEAQIQATASEVQDLLVSGRKQEALQCAQEGQLWGPALVLASQLGEQFYVDAVKQMALQQLVAGSPLRTLCLLIAGQPAEVFSTDTTGGNASNASQQQTQFGANVMLDDWEENLAVITANRTKDDELVIIHLGDCLWKERSNFVAAHICYLIAEANFESHSEGARLCLVGANHWKYPRTYANPEAIQRTELYEYSKVLGNSQFILLPFQPYKVLYAHMLAEVGRVSDSLKYCQAVLKSLKIGRAPEVETWKQLVLSLEERIRAHQQGGYYGNLAPNKIVGKLLNFFDSTAQKVVGGIPPAPSTARENVQGNDHYPQPMGNRQSTSQSSMAMSSLMPSASMERIDERSSDGNRRAMQNRSISEPDFSGSPGQVGSSNEKQSSNEQGKSSGSTGASGFSRFGFGSQILQKTVGLVMKPRSGRQAKLGEENKFYYNEKLKMWVEEGAEPPAEEAALPPPPTTAPFQNGMSDFNSITLPKNEVASTYSSPEYKSPTLADHSSGIPPIAPSSNQFSARGRMGVRARYVDTFNKGGGPAANSFQSSPVPAVKPAVAANAKFFIPTPAAPAEQTTDEMAENKQENVVTSESPLTNNADDPVQNRAPSPLVCTQRFPSMDNISRNVQSMGGNDSLLSQSRQTASWSGSLGDANGPKMAESKLPREALGMSPLAFSQNNQTSLHKRSNSGSFGDDLHEVEL